MKSLFKGFVGMFAMLPLVVFATQVEIVAQDGFKLSTEYFQPTNPQARGVLMLHQCNYNRTMYDEIGEALAQRGVHAISLDFRGFGKSITDTVNVDNFGSLAPEKKQQAWKEVSSHWKTDTQNTINYLRERVGEDGVIGVIGASCGGSQAISLSESNDFHALVLFSSGQDEQNIERYGLTLSSKPTLIIASEEDGGTFDSAQKIFAKASNKQSKFIAYKGELHGYPLYEQDVTLSGNIVEWFDKYLK